MKICPNCGNQLTDENVFCNNCGTNVSNVASIVAGAAVDAANKAPQWEGEARQDAVNMNQAANGAGNQPQEFGQQADFGANQQYNAGPAVQTYDPKDHTAEFDPRDIADNKIIAALPYFTLALGVVAALLVKESAYCKFHAKNAIRLEIAMVLALIPAIVPVIGWIVSAVLAVILVVVNIIAIVNVLQGKAKDLPIVGNIGFLK